MAKIKLTKSAVDAAQTQAQPVELRDTLVPGFLCKITPAGRKVFMLQYRTNAGERRKPALGLYGELTVEQARSLAQWWRCAVPPRYGRPTGTLPRWRAMACIAPIIIWRSSKDEPSLAAIRRKSSRPTSADWKPCAGLGLWSAWSMVCGRYRTTCWSMAASTTPSDWAM